MPSMNITKAEKELLLAGLDRRRWELEAERRSFTASRDGLRAEGEHEEADECHDRVIMVKRVLLDMYALQRRVAHERVTDAG
jgi:hypothetical protein